MFGAVKLWVVLGGILLLAGAAQAERPTLRVAYAGSMGAVMDHGLGPAFAQMHHVDYQGMGEGSYGLAHLIAGRQIRVDVFVAITPGPIRVVRRVGLMPVAEPVASTQMVIAYSPASRFVKLFRSAAAGKVSWIKVLEHPGVRFGRTDPVIDPQGRNLVLMMQLAARYYRQPGLVRKILGTVENPRQIFAEPSLLSRLEAGQIDASSGYLSAVISHHLPYIRLPQAINLSDPALESRWYRKAGFQLNGPDGAKQRVTVQPLVFYAGVLENAPHKKIAQAFVRYLEGMAARHIFSRFGYGPAKGKTLIAN